MMFTRHTHAPCKLHPQLGPKQSRSQSFVPLDQRSENESSGSIHFQITMEITEFCISCFTAQCAVCIYGIYGACLKWMLPELSFSDRWSRGTKLWERDWNQSNPSPWYVVSVRCVRVFFWRMNRLRFLSFRILLHAL